ncbi:MAG: methyltransferase domain-containing protein [Vicinamibacteria bacterium]|nr:methyltransferase domain-containing protein [Vicinamibacteria bacterium]
MVSGDFDGERYKRASRHQKEWGRRLVDGLALAPDASVLDLGCGDGVLTAAIARNVPRGRVLGVDSSPSMIETARALASDNVIFRLLDANDIDHDAEFDLVFSNATLHWIHDHERLLGRVRAALRPGGRIRFNFAGDGNCSNFIAVVRDRMIRSEYAACFAGFHWPWFMPAGREYEPLLHNAGFSDIVVKEENADRFFGSAQEMTAWIDQPSIVPFLRRLPADVAARLRDDVVRTMLSRTSRPDGRCFETFRRIDVSAARPKDGVL